MTTQREKDLARGCNEALKHRFADHPSFADGFADGAAYGRKDGYNVGWTAGKRSAAERLLEILNKPSYHGHELWDLARKLEADE